jgi:hypothetical protein
MSNDIATDRMILTVPMRGREAMEAACVIFNAIPASARYHRLGQALARMIEHAAGLPERPDTDETPAAPRTGEAQ